MAYDINSIHISGTVERFDMVDTRTGTPMIRFRLRCWKEPMQVVAFKDLATTTLLRPGERVEVKGRIQGTRWTDKDGSTRTGFQIVAQSIAPEPPTADAAHSRPQPQKMGKPGRAKANGNQQRLPSASSPWRKERPGVMVYQGGPF